MGCFVVLLAIISPRLALLLGFFILPWTTLAYAVMWAAGSNSVEGFEWFIVIVAATEAGAGG